MHPKSLRQKRWHFCAVPSLKLLCFVPAPEPNSIQYAVNLITKLIARKGTEKLSLSTQKQSRFQKPIAGRSTSVLTPIMRFVSAGHQHAERDLPATTRMNAIVCF
jgi:hypothetical protein